MFGFAVKVVLAVVIAVGAAMLAKKGVSYLDSKLHDDADGFVESVEHKVETVAESAQEAVEEKLHEITS